jgi:endonuclease YncB( thermonuclease family)
MRKNNPTAETAEKKKLVDWNKTKSVGCIVLLLVIMLSACDLIPSIRSESLGDVSALGSHLSDIPAGAEGLLDVSLPECVQNLMDYEIAYVTRVLDGDSIEVKIDGENEQVRYIGMNTPEYYSEERPAAMAATDLNRSLVEGQYVLLIRDVSDRDKYDRLLRYVFSEDGFVNAILVEKGAAEVKEYPPDTSCQDYLFQER